VNRLTFFTSTMTAAALIISISACGGNASSSTGPNPVPTSVTPTAPPATPPPATAPPVGSVSASCARIGEGNAKAGCNRTRPNSELLDQVTAAIDQVVAQQPALFNMNDQTVAGAPRVLDSPAYYAAVIRNLDAVGVCAASDLDQTILRVKNSNLTSDEYRLADSKGFVWRGPGSYSTSCNPANFPLAPAEEVASVLVIAYGYTCNEGIPAPERGAKLYPVGCDVIITATPKAADGQNVDWRIHGTEILWEIKEGEDVIAARQWPDVPFNQTLFAQKVGNFRICATVQSVTGCLRGDFIPNPTPAP